MSDPHAPSTSKPATIVDVSKAAGVAVATVSRVLNNSPLVTKDKSDHVRQIMEQLNYQPSGRAMKPKPRKIQGETVYHLCLILRKPYTFRLINARIAVYSEMIHGVIMRCQELGFNLVIKSMAENDSLAKILPRQRIDGLIFLGDFSDLTDTREIIRYPAVTVMGNKAPEWGDHVSYDNQAIGRLASDHLIAQGCRHAICCAIIYPGNTIRTERLSSFELYFRQAGGTSHRCDPAGNEVDSYGSLLAILRDGVLKALKEAGRPLGLFLAAEEYLSAIQAVLHAERLVIGKDVFIVSCGDAPTLERNLAPKIATIDLRSTDIGRRAVDRLFQRIQSKDESRKVLLLDPTLSVAE